MPTFMQPWTAQTYALMRIIVGLLFLCHGSSKLLGWPTPGSADAPAFVTFVAGPIELVGGLLVAIGLYAGWAAFLCSGTMAVAYFMAHAPQGFFPIVNRGELAVVYCFVFLYISAHGSGIWSIDASRKSS